MADRQLVSPEVLRKLLDYDPATGLFVWRPRDADMFSCPGHDAKWNARYAGAPALCTPHVNGYLYGGVMGRNVLAHRAAWAITSGAHPEFEIDHINGIRADNRIENLRPVTSAENKRNQARPNTNTTGVVGVTRHRRDDRWQAQIQVGGKNIYLGQFRTLDEAIAARQRAERIHGFHENHGRG
jgi:hypothetical protein